MGELTGQAGLTIDIETKWTMGEFAYQDAGFVVLKDLAMGGNSNEADATHANFSPFASNFLDNVRLTLDVAGAGGAGGGGQGCGGALVGKGKNNDIDSEPGTPNTGGGGGGGGVFCISVIGTSSSSKSST